MISVLRASRPAVRDVQNRFTTRVVLDVELKLVRMKPSGAELK